MRPDCLLVALFDLIIPTIFDELHLDDFTKVVADPLVVSKNLTMPIGYRVNFDQDENRFIFKHFQVAKLSVDSDKKVIRCTWNSHSMILWPQHLAGCDCKEFTRKGGMCVHLGIAMKKLREVMKVPSAWKKYLLPSKSETYNMFFKGNRSHVVTTNQSRAIVFLPSKRIPPAIASSQAEVAESTAQVDLCEYDYIAEVFIYIY